MYESPRRFLKFVLFLKHTIKLARRSFMPKTSVSKPGNPFHSTGGNFPSKTGNVSGGNRGNNPPASRSNAGNHGTGGARKK